MSINRSEAQNNDWNLAGVKSKQRIHQAIQSAINSSKAQNNDWNLIGVKSKQRIYKLIKRQRLTCQSIDPKLKIMIEI